MDRKKLQALENLFKNLVDNPKVFIQEIYDAKLSEIIPKLIEMGLDLELNRKYIRLKNHCEVTDTERLKEQLLAQKVTKPLYCYFTTTSTNALAKKDKIPAIYLTEHQSFGHGRQSKQWLSPLGQSIALSLNHTIELGLQDISGLNIAIGVAIISAVNSFGQSNLGLKWPNDVFSPNGKVGGILIEISGNSKQSHITIGIGINWKVRQSLLNAIPQKCDNIYIKDCSKAAFILTLIIKLEEILQEFSKNKLKNILPIWHKHDVFTGSQINVIESGKEYQAKYLEVTQQGMLSIQLGNKIKTIASGEVSIRKVD